MSAARADRLVELLDGAGVEAMLVTELVNVRYLTGYTGSNGLAVIGPAVRTFITDFRYVEQAAAEVDGSFERVRAPQELIDAVAEQLPEGRIRLGFEDHAVSVRNHARLVEQLADRAELVAAGGLVEQLRAVKEPGELERIAAAAALADASFSALLERGLAGRTERELAVWLEHDMRERGATAPSFEAIVAAGGHGALPHAQPRDVAVQRGDLVVIDWGARLDGYCSDCTRTVAVSSAGAEQREAYELVLEAQLAGLDAVRAGVGGRDADGVARAVIAAGGHGEHFGHGLGHGVGLDIHEAPRLSQRSEDTLVTGNVVTVEPGVYLPERFGIRIEDLVVVGEERPRILTGLSKDLTVVD
jgi:Xaa-Pro aminopeptidase